LLYVVDMYSLIKE